MDLETYFGYSLNESMKYAIDDYGERGEKSYYVAGIDLEARLFYDLIGLGFSAGLCSGGLVERYKHYEGYTFFGYVSGDYERSLQLYSVIYTGTLYFKVFNYNKHIILLGAGAGRYDAGIEYYDDESDTDRDYRGSTTGYHAKIEYHYLLGNRFDVLGGFMYRYAKIDGFSSRGETLVLNGVMVKGNFTGFFMDGGIGLRF